MIDTALDLLLMNYAGGSLSPLESLMVAAHMAINPAARRKVATFEAAGGQMICESTPAKVSDKCLESLLAKIDGGAEPTAAQKEACRKTAEKLNVPFEVFTLMAQHCVDQRYDWIRIADGAHMIEFTMPCRSMPAGHLRLMRFEPHFTTPAHGHSGIEITLVLAGSYLDDACLHTAGELMIATKDSPRHAPVAGPDGCLCLVMTDAPLRFQNPLRQLMSVIFRL